jgi:hypothetical protein
MDGKEARGVTRLRRKGGGYGGRKSGPLRNVGPTVANIGSAC